MIEPVRTNKLAETVARHMEQLIVEGVLRPGEKLASERDLAERFAVSRPTLREALAILERSGLVEVGKGGTVIAEFLAPLTSPLAALMRADARMTDDYFEFRQTIEGKAAAFAARRATDLDRESIRACLARMDAAHALDDPTAETHADADLHLLIYEAAHNLVLLHVMRAFSQMLRQDVFFNREALYLLPGVRDAYLTQHHALAEAVLAGDAARAEEAAMAHIRYAHDTLEEMRRADARLNVAARRLGRADLVAD